MLRPMLAAPGREQVLGAGWRFEPKLDGWRALVTVDGKVTVRTRTGRDVMSVLPELAGLTNALTDRTVVLDGELIVGAGRARDFYGLTPRMTLGPRRAGSGCRVTFVAFDVLHLDGRDVCSQPYVERRALLEGLRLAGPCWHVIDSLDCDPLDALLACLDLGVEGLIAKRNSSLYWPGQRSPDWVKLKTPEWRAAHTERRVKR